MNRYAPAALLVSLLLLAVVLIVCQPIGIVKGDMPTCMSNLKQLGLAVLQYDADNKRLSPSNLWVDLTSPHIRDKSLYDCPALSVPKSGHAYGYAMNDESSNAELAGMSPSDQAHRAIVFESTVLARNASGTTALVPLPGRHAGKSCRAFLDGHAEVAP